MANETANMLYGPVRIYRAPVGEAVPSENSIALGVAWGGNWVNIGYADAPLACNRTTTEVEKMIELVTAPVDRMISEEHWVLETTLAELTLTVMQLAYGGGTLTPTAAGGAQVQKEELAIGGAQKLTKYAYGFEGTFRKDDGTEFPVRVFFYKMTAKATAALTFGRTAYVGIPVQFQALADLSQTAGQQICKWQKVLAPHT